nr:MAG TPA: hypothetical protein [Caudoviricetes sp.]
MILVDHSYHKKQTNIRLQFSIEALYHLHRLLQECQVLQ